MNAPYSIRTPLIAFECWAPNIKGKWTVIFFIQTLLLYTWEREIEEQKTFSRERLQALPKIINASANLGNLLHFLPLNHIVFIHKKLRVPISFQFFILGSWFIITHKTCFCPLIDDEIVPCACWLKTWGRIIV